jgi:hypothetical protein
MPVNSDRIEEALKLVRIKTRNAYTDELSEEPYTGKIKRKHKLAVIQIHDLGEYWFFVFTSDPSACKSKYLFTVLDHHWEHKAPNVNLPKSHCDPTRYEWLSKNDLLTKIDDPNNGFKYAAKLSLVKYTELQNIIQRASADLRMSKEVDILISKGMLDTVDDLAKKLGI